MKIYIVIKDKENPNPYDCPNDEYVLIDSIKTTEDSARERLCELAKEGYRNCDYLQFTLK